LLISSFFNGACGNKSISGNFKTKIMLQANQTLDLSAIGAKFIVRKTSRDTNGKSFDMEWELEPHTLAPPVHIHPHAIETYTIMDGEMDVFIKDKWSTAHKGEKIVVEKGVPHTYKNSTDKIITVYNTHEPAMQFENFFEGLGKVCNSGVIKNKKMNINAIQSMSILWTKYPNEIKSVKPPSFIMKIMSWIGKLRGIKF
jgi:mannose-6-phosphate isomerase-like protein (cupin superfamily)